MKALTRVTLLMLCLYAFSNTGKAYDDWGGLRFGYLNSTLLYRPGNLEVEVNDFNRLNPVKEPFDIPNRMQGFHLGFSRSRRMTDNVFLLYQVNVYTRKLKSWATMDNGDRYGLKVKVNNIQIMGAGVRFKYFEFYASVMDLTFTTVAKKEPGKDSWVSVYEKKKSWNFGQTLSASAILPFGENVSLELLCMYQSFWFRSKHGIPFRPENFSLGINLAMRFET